MATLFTITASYPGAAHANDLENLLSSLNIQLDSCDKACFATLRQNYMVLFATIKQGSARRKVVGLALLAKLGAAWWFDGIAANPEYQTSGLVGALLREGIKNLRKHHNPHFVFFRTTYSWFPANIAADPNNYFFLRTDSTDILTFPMNKIHCINNVRDVFEICQPLEEN